ncbi:hypothetical protein EUA04_11385 [Mycolicibacterium obuense]|uniref:Uncharacterized protein n=1 Tax=Mycolicibacterium obuense TaxID=1807 RepID=A0A4R5XC37_9MYCO|nr:hypothetical protein [Mycolicibacterium obuense]TDL10482.1 hypothetical protein EUA04_11385 [Mycolicibacterium obuense]
MIITGCLVLLLATVFGLVGVLSDFSLVGSHVTGSQGAVFLYGVVIGAAAASGAAVLFAGVCRAVSRSRDARRQQARARRETAFINRAHARVVNRR